MYLELAEGQATEASSVEEDRVGGLSGGEGRGFIGSFGLQSVHSVGPKEINHRKGVKKKRAKSKRGSMICLRCGGRPSGW